MKTIDPALQKILKRTVEVIRREHKSLATEEARMTIAPSIVPDAAPPVPLPSGMIVPPLRARWTREGELLHRECQVPIFADGKMHGLWKANRLAFLQRGWSIRQHDGKWVLGQWLKKDGSNFTLTVIGQEKVNAIVCPHDDLITEEEEVTLELPELPAELASKLYDYQVNPARQLLRALTSGETEWGYNGAWDCSDLGTGKTYQALAAAIATGLEVGVICPLSVIPSWQKAFRHFGQCPRFIRNYESLRTGKRDYVRIEKVVARNGQPVRRFRWDVEPKDTVLLFDEAHCFPSHTLVSTERGLLSIGEIVRQKISIRVFSFDHGSKTVTLRSVTNWFTNPPDALVRIRHEHGELICTGNHQIFTERGWISAGGLTPNDLLRILPTSVPQEVVKSEVLQQFVRREAKDSISGLAEKSFTMSQGTGASAETNELAGCGVSANEGTKPNGERCGQGANARIAERAHIPFARRQWSNDATAEGGRGGSLFAHGARHRHSDGCATQVHESTEELQGGHSVPRTSPRHRDRREYSQTEKVEVLRPEERRNTFLSRVDSVEVLECRGGSGLESRDDDDSLYDIEVEGTHCYFADGVLVHNCVKNAGTLNQGLASAAIRQKFPVIFISGTLASDPTHMRATGRAVGLHQGEDSYISFLNVNGCVGESKNGKGWSFYGGHRGRKILANLHRTVFPKRGARTRIADLGDRFPETQIIAESYETGETKAIADAFKEAQRTIQQLEAQGDKSEGEINMLKASAYIRAWHESERLKVPALCEMVHDEIEEGRSVALFVNFTDVREALMHKIKTGCAIFGGQPASHRQRCIEDFQSGRSRVIVANIDAGGVGVSLHDESGDYPRTAIILPTNKVASLVQALGRVHRAGGKSKSRQIIFFASGTVEEGICDAVRARMANITTINDGDMNPEAKF